MITRRYVQLVAAACILLASPSFSVAEPIDKKTYAGSETCRQCHLAIYNTYRKTGHPYKLQKLSGGPPSYPEGTSPGVPQPPPGFEWSRLSYVIGGFAWKARFLDDEGYILTGDENRQYNLANSALDLPVQWSGYDADNSPRKPYTCGGCHTTGWTATGKEGPHQDGLPGIYGTWAEPGVTCEACHGHATAHVANPKKSRLSTKETCAMCHRRGDAEEIDAKGGLIRHHEQYEELLASPHRQMACGTCHDPHTSVKYTDTGQQKKGRCIDCHADVRMSLPLKQSFACKTCHMPRIAKSALSRTRKYSGGEVLEGDIRTHIFSISSDGDWEMFTTDGKLVKKDSANMAHLAVTRVCLLCHKRKDETWARTQAKRIHK